MRLARLFLTATFLLFVCLSAATAIAAATLILTPPHPTHPPKTHIPLLTHPANMLLRIDDIVSGISKRQAGGGGGGPSGPQVDDHENVDTEAMLPE